MSLDKRSIELGTEGWGVKEDNLLAFRKDRTRYVEKPFTFPSHDQVQLPLKSPLTINSFPMPEYCIYPSLFTIVPSDALENVKGFST